MSKHYLLYDGACFKCVALAAKIAEQAESKITTLSLYSAEGQELLKQAMPDGWDHKPYLITVDNIGGINAATDFKMSLKLALLLGPVKGLRIYKLAQSMGVKLIPSANPNRRTFLKRSGLLAGGIFLAALPTQKLQVFQLDNGEGKAEATTLKGTELKRAITEAQNHPDYKELSSYILERNFKLEDGSIQAFSILVTKGTQQTRVLQVVIPFSSLIQDTSADKTKLAQACIIYSASPSNTLIGGLISQRTVTSSGTLEDQIAIVEVVGNTATHKFTLVRKKDKTQDELVILDARGEALRTVPLPGTGGVTTQASLECNVCGLLYDILLNIGCGILTYGACIIACAPFGTLACPIICGILIGFLCNTAGAPSKEIACESFCG